MSNARPPRFRELDGLPLGVAVLDAALVVRFWNRALEAWTGLDRDAVLGRPLAAVAPPWGGAQYRERLAPVFQGGPPVVFSPVLHPRILPAAEGQTFNVKASALEDDAGGYWALVSVEDITVLSQRIAKLRQLQRQSDLLLREIHHRVKNNLNMISGLIVLQADRSPPETARILGDLQGRIIAISQVHDVLYHTDDLAMGQAADYLGPLAELLDANLSERGSHELQLDLDKTLAFDLDATLQLGLIQAELLTNALKYGLGNRPGGWLRIELRRVDERTAVYRLSHSGDTLAADFDPRASQGLGMQLLLAYAGRLSGELTWAKGDPTSFTLTFEHRRA